MMSEQPKRRPGRPPLANKPARHDIHLWLPTSLVKAIDAKRSAESRTEYIIRVLVERVASPE